MTPITCSGRARSRRPCAGRSVTTRHVARDGALSAWRQTTHSSHQERRITTRRITMASYERKDLKSPDETRTFEKGRVELINIGGGTVGRLTLESGWGWS